MFQTTAFVLKKTPFYEVDNLITLYSQDFGKIEVVSRGSQKITSKLSAHLEVLNLISLEFVYGQNFKVATSAQIIESFQNIKNDFCKTKLVLEIFDYIDKYVFFEEQDLNFWQFLTIFLDEMEKMSEMNRRKSEILKIYFSINFLKFLGFLPSLKRCSRCGNSDFKKVYLISKQGLLCEKCIKSGDNILSLESKEFNFLKNLPIRKNFTAVKFLRMEENQLTSQNFNKIQTILDKFLIDNVI